MGDKTKEDEIDNKYYLFGLLNSLANRFQAAGDKYFEEISWKQWFVLIGISIYKEPPTINEVAEVIGSSHQNVKQILLKLEKIGFVVLYTDELDRRKIRIKLTDKKSEFDSKYYRYSSDFIEEFYQGLNEKDIAVTLKTLLVIEKNLINIKR